MVIIQPNISMISFVVESVYNCSMSKSSSLFPDQNLRKKSPWRNPFNPQSSDNETNIYFKHLHSTGADMENSLLGRKTRNNE